MPKVWDTIIIGAGIGGLTAAAHLAKAGLHVLVLDRNSHPGGTAYVYQRKGFTFPMGPLGFSQPELIQETLRDLEIGGDFKLSRVHYRLRAFDLDVPLSLPIPEMVKELSRFYHSEEDGIKEFFKLIEETTSSNHLSLKRIPNISASEYLHHLIKDWRLLRILGSIGTLKPHSRLSLLAAMWDLMCRKGIWYPKEGMQSFCDRFVKAVKRNFGEIRLRTEVEKIRIEKGKVMGITLRDATEIDSGSVISNADYKNTFIKLIKPEAIPPEWYHAVFNARQTNSIFQVCLGVDSGRADLSTFKEANRLIYRRNQKKVDGEGELNWDAAEIDPESLAGQELEVSLWGRDDKILSPEGGAVIVIRTEAEYFHFVRYRSVSNKRGPEYQDYKNHLARAFINEVENLIPGLKNSILVMDVATPLTFEDQGGRSGGAVAGWSWDYEDFRDDKPKELIRTPIKGLYMAGYQAFSALFMGGVPTAMESGKRAAKAVIEVIGPMEEISIPGSR
jgi:phytoene dehydrogenase-like protein